jgi:hypothetical protein
MASIRWEEHKGKKILYMDFAYSKYSEILQAIQEATEIIEKEPAFSILGLVDVRQSPFNREVATGLKDFASHNKPYMKVSAVVGVEGIKMVIFNAVLKFTGRKNLVLKDTIEEAKDWLVEQA